MICHFCKHTSIAICTEEAKSEWQPLPIRCYRDQIQQENQQIIRMSRFRRQRLVMDNFEINEPRPAGLLVINNVIHAGITV
jgi:hypothetical protein